jgi:hypothetical protein
MIINLMEQTVDGFLNTQNVPKWIPLSNKKIFIIIDDIKIYDNTTPNSRDIYNRRIKYLKSLTADNVLFTPLVASTLTAQGRMSGVEFDEKELITRLTVPTGHIRMAGCNFGEILNPNCIQPEEKKQSIRGRKPKPKNKIKRKTQGNGKYFSSQITFPIQAEVEYKIKMFRNGVFQVPGVRNPLMTDLISPIKELKDYLQQNFPTVEVRVEDFAAVMRNYKSRLINEHYHVNLERLEEIITAEKSPRRYDEFLQYMLHDVDECIANEIKQFIGNYNPLQIAEMTYNTDRCFCLIIKFYRPSVDDSTKKTTVKLLKKGKINFDGGNSQQEVEELYYWLRHLYTKYADEILTDVREIINAYDDSDCSACSVYDIESKFHIEHRTAHEEDVCYDEETGLFTDLNKQPIEQDRYIKKVKRYRKQEKRPKNKHPLL